MTGDDRATFIGEEEVEPEVGSRGVPPCDRDTPRLWETKSDEPPVLEVPERCGAGVGLIRGSDDDDDDMEATAPVLFSWTGEGTCTARGRGAGRGVGAVPSELDLRLSASKNGMGESGCESCDRRGGNGDAARGLDIGGRSRRDFSMVVYVFVGLLLRSCSGAPRITS